MLHSVYPNIDKFGVTILNDGSRLLTTNYRHSEYLSIQGKSYYFEIDKNFAAGEALWIKFTPPTNKTVEVLVRQMSPDLAGCKYELFRDTTGFSIISPVTVEPFIIGGAPASSTLNIITTPTTIGTKYVTPIFIGKGGGQNANSRVGGTNSSESGFWIYPPNSVGFFGRLTNTSGAINNIVFRFEFGEV